MTLRIEQLRVVYQRRGRPPLPAVDGVDLEVGRARIVGLIGESGSGKSSLGRTAVGLVRPTSGQVLFDGAPVRVIGARSRPGEQRRLQMVFQNPFESLNPRRRVGSQIRDGVRYMGSDERSRFPTVEKLLETVGLDPVSASKYPHEFSGGQRQRIAIARALAVAPTIMVLDEPLASLDASAQAQLANTMRTLADQSNVGMLLISHDIAIVRHIADSIAVMYLGQIVERGPTAEVWSRPMHPYTEALIEAIPAGDVIGHLPAALRGEVPDAAAPPTGCRFHTRCAYSFARCRESSPPLVAMDSRRAVACWLHERGVIQLPIAKAHGDRQTSKPAQGDSEVRDDSDRTTPPSNGPVTESLLGGSL